MSKKVIILGAGLTGLSAAYHLEKLRLSYRIFEKEDMVGGLCRSKNIDGFTFDYDGHLLHFKSRTTFKLIKGLLKSNLVRHKRNAWIYSFGRYTRYPFQANLYGLPLAVVEECLLGFIKANDGQLRKDDSSLLGWIQQTFGEGIVKHFMLPYNIKFWKVPLNELTCEWVHNYIPVPRLDEVIEGSLKESKIRFGYNSYFWYPHKSGIQGLTHAFAKKIKNLFISCEVIKINIHEKLVYFKNGRKERFDILISTLPLVEIINIIDGLPEDIVLTAKRLSWISIFNVNLGIDRPSISNRHWIYFPEKKYIFYRVGFPCNFSPFLVPPGTSSLYVEVSYPPFKQIDKGKLSSRIIKDLIKAKVILERDKILVQDSNDVKYGYVIYDRHHRYVTGKILDFLASRNIFSIGRFGSWRYTTMEDAILEGKRVAKKIAKFDV